MKTVSLDDKYAALQGRVYLTGAQALVRLPLDQARRDAARGLKTAGFISGYRGSPLGTYDLALWQAERHLEAHHIHFAPGVNEDLAATAVWGSQQNGLIGKSRFEGVFALWYGKGPGVDRSADALKHGNYAGSSAKGGVLVLCGDDHAARSSTLAHQSDHALIHCGIPILNPSDLQEYLDLGLLGFELSRFSGCWIGFKCVTDVVDSSSSVAIDGARIQVAQPGDYLPPPGGLSIRLEVAALSAEARVFEQRLQAAQAFARANRLDRAGPGKTGRKRLGIVSSGKSWRDTHEALARLGIGASEAEALGIGTYKVSMVWPLEPQGIKAFAAECDDLLVIEEKRGVIEEQVASLLFNLPAAQRPRLLGKHDAGGGILISEVGELDPDKVLYSIASSYLARQDSAEMRGRLAAAQSLAKSLEKMPSVIRLPAFCAGCPHNTSTRVPEGSIATAGIGCHGMAVLMPERNTLPGYHMGGEGAAWIGLAPFSETSHIFQNLGDGTYFHSGLLAIRACIASGVNITYKILLNGAVGMTGGQPIEGEQFAGEITAPHIAHQVVSEGATRVAVVSEAPEKFSAAAAGFPAGTTFHHRDDLDAVQQEIRQCKGVSVLIYDQSCATERRRLRKRGKLPEPKERLFINPQVCEGCGDCGLQSNCIAIEPLDTDFGRKRKINQSTCNKDYSCLKGFCPSFVTVVGGRPRAAAGEASLLANLTGNLPAPAATVSGPTVSLLVTGIGGSGVITIGAILGMAAHLEGQPCTVLDMSGFAQRNGSVMSHVRFGAGQDETRAPRIPSRGADVVIGCDPIVTAGPDSLGMMAEERTSVVMNRFLAPTSSFAANPDLQVDLTLLARGITRRLGSEQRLHEVDASGIAVRLLGDAIGANLFLVGFAFQLGLIPVTSASIESAIRLNGTAADMNLRAFGLGRAAVARPQALAELLASNEPKSIDAEDLGALVAHRSAHLTGYQNESLARRYQALVERVERAEQALGPGATGLALTVARVYAKLLSYKDEYEVARLFTQQSFQQQLDSTFSGDVQLKFHMAPPLFARRDRKTGRLRKIELGSWMRPVLAVLAKLRDLRGTPFDVFGYSAHRRMERELIGEYELLIETIIADLTLGNHAAAIELARVYDLVRGYDVVKEGNVAKMRAQLPAVRAAFEAKPIGGAGGRAPAPRGGDRQLS